MKIKIALLLVFFWSFYGIKAQDSSQIVWPIDPETQQIKIQEVVDMDADKNELFNRCINFVNNYYKDPLRVTSERDLADGLVSGRHRFRVYHEEEGFKKEGAMILYEFKIELKDGRYRYTLTNIMKKETSRFPIERWLDPQDSSYNSYVPLYLQQVHDYFENWANTLKEYMQPPPDKVVDDW